MDCGRTISTDTVSRGNCVGCGVCAVVCPSGAVSVRFDSRRGTPVPSVDADKCVRCGLCAKTCGHSAGNLAALCRRVSSAPDPARVGLEDARSFLARDPSPGRARSVSGGVVTAVARELLRQGRIAGVIHAERVAAKRGEPHYRTVLSRTPDEVDSRRGIAYEPLDFSEILAGLDPSATYLVVGTPCVVRNVKALEKAPGAPRPKFVACALVCSHNVTTRFADFMADRAGIPRETPFFYDPRDKDDIPDAENYNTRFRGEDGGDLYKENRFASGWTEYWRGYAFALPACCRCPDFWGMEADFSVKDAWGRKEWTSDPLGTSIAIFRNPDMLEAARNAGLELEALPEQAFVRTQPGQTGFKQVQAARKIEASPFGPTGIRTGLLRKLAVSGASRRAYRFFGRRAAQAAVAVTEASFNAANRSVSLFRKLKARIAGFGKRFAVQGKRKQILVAGGYGYGNVGDEAQCAVTLARLRDRYPGFDLVDLSPDPGYSRRVHPGYRHEFASRVAFFDHRCAGDVFKLESAWDRIRFLATMFWIRANASLVKRNLPTLLINARKASMLRLLSESSMLYFCGGGYLTGPTRSRLWDGALLCRLCRVFGVPVAMSGQTIGIWPGRLDRWIARWGFRHVAAITTRDESESIRDLSSIGFRGEAFPAHDDALFCGKSGERQVPHERYVAFNFHFWGMDGAAREETLAKMHEALAAVKNRLPGRAAVFLPMTPSDMNAFRLYSARHPEDGLEVFRHDFDYRKTRRAVADADLVVTMKHHPIIFAVGEGVPVVSLAFSPYYERKNSGALSQYGLEKASVVLSDRDWSAKFAAALAAVSDPETAKTVRDRKQLAKDREERFFLLVDRLLGVRK